MSEDELELEDGDSGAEESTEDITISPSDADDTFSNLYTEPEEYIPPTPCSFVCGIAGSGKTYEILRRCQDDPEYAALSASTGISAVNLSSTTIHSLLGFSDLNSLRDSKLQKSAHRKLRKLAAEGYKNVVIDEISMISHQMLDLLVDVFDDVNEDLRATRSPIGLILVGDFAQLPPIAAGKGKHREPTPWAFDANCWHRFEENTERLTTNRRQSDARFLEALNHARAGRGHECVEILKSAGCEFHTYTDMEFDGSTILSKNDEVDSYNAEALKRVSGRSMVLPSRRWGQLSKAWENVPVRTELRENAYVMLLANAPGAAHGTFEYANGDCGHVRGAVIRTGLPTLIEVELVRTGEIVKVPPIVRGMEHREKPEGFSGVDKVEADYFERPHYSRQKRRYISGQIKYYPIRLAFGTTAHKSQGLSLDRCQVDVRGWMWKEPAMTYIAMSRCRSLEGLRIVGQKEVVAEKCKSDPRVARWL